MRNVASGLTTLLSALAVVWALLVLPSPQATAAGTSFDHTVTTVTDKAFTVTWFTTALEPGYVEWGTTASLGNTANDDRGNAVSDDTHHVTIAGLEPATTYYYDIISGGTRYDNSGAHYQIATGATLLQPGSDLVYGQVFKADGATPAEGTIVYLRVVDSDGSGNSGSSQTYSALVESSGYWSINIGTIRTADLSHWFAYSASGDSLVIEANGGSDGNGSVTVDTASDSPAASIAASTALLPGDANGDGTVDSLDITSVERIIARLDDRTPGADANQDGEFDARDITRTEMIVAGLD